MKVYTFTAVCLVFEIFNLLHEYELLFQMNLMSKLRHQQIQPNLFEVLMIRVTTKKKEIRIMIPPNPPFPRRSKPEKNRLLIEIGHMTKTSISFLLLLERKKHLRRKLQFQNKAKRSRFNRKRKIEELMEEQSVRKIDDLVEELIKHGFTVLFYLRLVSSRQNTKGGGYAELPLTTEAITLTKGLQQSPWSMLKSLLLFLDLPSIVYWAR